MVHHIRTNDGALVWDNDERLNPGRWTVPDRKKLTRQTPDYRNPTRRTWVPDDDRLYHEVLVDDVWPGFTVRDEQLNLDILVNEDTPKLCKNKVFTGKINPYLSDPEKPREYVNCSFLDVAHEFFAPPGTVFRNCRFVGCMAHPLVLRRGPVAVLDCEFANTISGPFIQLADDQAGFLFVNTGIRTWHGHNTCEGICKEGPGNVTGLMAVGTRYDGPGCAFQVQGAAENVTVHDLLSMRGTGVWLWGDAEQHVSMMRRARIHGGSLVIGPRVSGIHITPQHLVSVIDTTPGWGADATKPLLDRKPVVCESPHCSLAGVNVVDTKRDLVNKLVEEKIREYVLTHDPNVKVV